MDVDLVEASLQCHTLLLGREQLCIGALLRRCEGGGHCNASSGFPSCWAPRPITVDPWRLAFSCKSRRPAITVLITGSCSFSFAAHSSIAIAPASVTGFVLLI